MIDAALALTPTGFAQLETDYLRSEIRVYPARTFHPSSIGNPCDRALVWNFTKSDVKKAHHETLQAIFDLGREWQAMIFRRLDKLGFECVSESDRPVQYKIGRAIISGRPDGRIIAFRGEKYRPARILEAKSMNSHHWEKISTLDDIRHSPSVFVRSYYEQGILYAFLENVPSGVFVLANKHTGRLKIIPFDLDYEHAERLLQRVERLQPVIDDGIDPEPISYDWSICGRCGFLDICFPARNFGEGTSVIDDPEFVELLDRRAQLRPASKEYDEIDTAVKARLRHEGIADAIAGPFAITGSKRHRKAYAVAENDYVEYRITRVEVGAATGGGKSDGSSEG